MAEENVAVSVPQEPSSPASLPAAPDNKITYKYNHAEEVLDPSKDEDRQTASELIREGRYFVEKGKQRLSDLENDEGMKILKDLASGYGISHVELARKIQSDIEAEKAAELMAMGMPEDLSLELVRLRELDRQLQEDAEMGEAKTAQYAEIDRQIAEFQEAYPDVAPESIPQEVFDICAEDIPLLYAYQIYEGEKIQAQENIKHLNDENAAASMGSAATAGNTSPGELSPDSIKNMSREERQRRMPEILKAIQSGRLRV